MIMTTINDSQRALIEAIINCFETGSAKGDYTEVDQYHDGPNKIKQITFGRSQTTEYGHLPALLKEYCDQKGQYTSIIEQYLPKLCTGWQPDSTFIQALKDSGKEPLMIKLQDQLFDTCYWQPASAWFTQNKFTCPLSMLAIYDSYVHSGHILLCIRVMFREAVPINGGDEKAWVEQYCKSRLHWLANNQNPVLHPTVYRMNFMLSKILEQDWDLTQFPMYPNDVKINQWPV